MGTKNHDERPALSASRIEWLDHAVAPVLEALLQTGEFTPTLYVHGAEGTQPFMLAARALGELREEAAACIRDRVRGAEGYVLVYPSVLRFGDKPYTVLIVETAGAEDETAEELARRYWRDEQRVAERFDRLGPVDNLLDRA